MESIVSDDENGDLGGYGYGGGGGGGGGSNGGSNGGGGGGGAGGVEGSGGGNGGGGGGGGNGIGGGGGGGASALCEQQTIDATMRCVGPLLARLTLAAVDHGGAAVCTGDWLGGAEAAAVV